MLIVRTLITLMAIQHIIMIISTRRESGREKASTLLTLVTQGVVGGMEAA